MKKILMIVCMMTVTMCTFAQFQQRSHSKVNTTSSQGVVKHSKKTSAHKRTPNAVVSDEDYHSAGSFEPAMETCFGYLIPSGISDGYKNGFSCAISAGFGACYNVSDDVYFKGVVGYKYVSTTIKPENSKSSKYDSKSTVHNITLPLHLGYRLSEKCTIFVGSRIDFPVSAKSEYDNKETKIETNTTAAIECGFNLGMFRIMYDYSPAKSNKYSLISIGLSL